MNTAMKWIDEVRGTDSIREVARRAGLNQATLNRQVNLDQLTFDVVRDVSRAYARSLLADLVRTGFLAEADVAGDGIASALKAANDEQLVLEVASRLEITTIGTIYDKPVSEAVREAGELVEGRFPPANVDGVDETRRVAKKKSRDRGEDDGGGA